MAEDVLAALRAKFRERCVTDAADLRAHLADPALDAKDVERLVHRLAGAAGTFGFADLGAAAIEVDTLFAEGGTPSAEVLADLARKLEAVAAGS